MYDKFQGLIMDLIDLGKKMDTMKDRYGDLMRKLHLGKGNLVSSVERIKRLGANTTKSLPQQLLDRADDEDESFEENENDLFENNK